MKIHLSPSNKGYSRTQWLLIICLCMIAFELGVRFSKKGGEKQVVTRTITTNTVVTNLGVTIAEVEPPEEVLDAVIPVVTNQPLAPHVRKALPTNTYTTKSSGGGVKEWVQPTSTPAEGPSYKRKSFATNSVLTAAPVGDTGSGYGVRIAVP